MNALANSMPDTGALTEHGILFTGDMVRSLLAGAKSQTRRRIGRLRIDGKQRIINRIAPAFRRPGQYVVHLHDGTSVGPFTKDMLAHLLIVQAGHSLWVRETWQPARAGVRYRADFPGMTTTRPWKPAIHMHRSASRITLEVTGVRVERIQDITRDDAIAEGIERSGPGTWMNYGKDGACFAGPDGPIQSYHSLIESIQGKGWWEENPLIAVYEFRRAA